MVFDFGEGKEKNLRRCAEEQTPTTKKNIINDCIFTECLFSLDELAFIKENLF